MKKSIVVVIVLTLVINALGQTSSNKNLEESINEIFESYAHYNRFIGSVLISKEDNIIYKKSLGYSDMDNHKKNTENSILSIASVTKSLTAVGVMRLVEEGKLTLETPICTYFPSFMPDFSKNSQFGTC
jgi:CubicO group peptidase (beta-lactamase class C family)